MFGWEGPFFRKADVERDDEVTFFVGIFRVGEALAGDDFGGGWSYRLVKVDPKDARGIVKGGDVNFEATESVGEVDVGAVM